MCSFKCSQCISFITNDAIAQHRGVCIKYVSECMHACMRYHHSRVNVCHLIPPFDTTIPSVREHIAHGCVRKRIDNNQSSNNNVGGSLTHSLTRSLPIRYIYHTLDFIHSSIWVYEYMSVWVYECMSELNVCTQFSFFYSLWLIHSQFRGVLLEYSDIIKKTKAHPELLIDAPDDIDTIRWVQWSTCMFKCVK